eukprot:COSAG01_NODE_66840_length_268_cov_22.550296_1_plen_49_part_10
MCARGSYVASRTGGASVADASLPASAAKEPVGADAGPLRTRVVRFPGGW